jgi:hypothetical protein
MQNIRPNFSRLIAFAIFGFLIASSLGCSNSSGPPTTSTVTVPKVGSTFVLYKYELDSTGAKISGTEKYDTVKVIASGITYQGKTNVNHFHSSQNYEIFLNYESNGDISGYIDHYGSPGYRSGWGTLPLVGKGKNTIVTFDTTYANGSQERVTTSYTYTGEETVTLLNHDFRTQTLNFEESLQNGAHGPIEKDWVSSELGYLVKSRTPFGLSRYGTNNNGYYTELVSYVLK